VEADALDDAIQQLQADLDAERRERLKLRTDFDLLSSKLRTPGTKFLVDLEYRLVYDATVEIAHSMMVTGALVETLPGTLHAVYAVSAYAPSSNTPLVITDGSIIVPPGNTFSVALQRRRQTSPTRIETTLVYYNFTGVDQFIAVRVWRRLGMGS
jgi:hypothetical protein